MRRQFAGDHVCAEEIPIIGALQNYPVKGGIGLEHTGFCHKRRSRAHVSVAAETRQEAIRNLNGLQVVRVVVIKGNQLYMRPEARHLGSNRLLEAHDDTDGQNHDHYPDDNPGERHPYCGPRMTRFSLLREIKSLCYLYFGSQRHDFCWLFF